MAAAAGPDEAGADSWRRRSGAAHPLPQLEAEREGRAPRCSA